MHTCPMVTGVVPHVGGPITGPGSPTVLIGGMPAAVMGDMCVCVGPPDTIAKGSATVMIGGKPAARIGRYYCPWRSNCSWMSNSNDRRIKYETTPTIIPWTRLEFSA